ncbi:MAG: alpha/beta hydrolase [Dysgonamonadaceae bacterium]|nr:alpha/beta hydrolase [Dysgonamonadaceae bacterium]
MKHYFFFFFILIGLTGPLNAQPVAELQKWLADGGQGAIETQRFAKMALSKTEADSAAQCIYSYFSHKESSLLKHEWVTRCMRADTLIMPIEYRIYGEKPEGGRSLYISMHGGGGTTAEVNDGQWLNQIRLYKPDEGVYVAPRAAVDAWNMWHQPHVGDFFDRIIRAAILTEDVNPDRVYILGYSAGGDGVYRLAPRMADRWAAASMMAGHPGGVSLLNVRNIGLMLWMGANDAAYDRNQEARKYGAWLDSMAVADKGGYAHETHLVEGKGHWMDRADTAAIHWMARFTRNPLPTKVVWRQDEVPQTAFYWLATTETQAQNGNSAIVERSGNTFTVLQNDYKTLLIGVNDEMIDFDRPVKVVSADGKILFKAKVKRTAASILRSIEAKHDKRLIFTAYIELNL